MAIATRPRRQKFFTMTTVIVSTLALLACVGGSGGEGPSTGVSGTVTYVTYTADLSTRAVTPSGAINTAGTASALETSVSVNAGPASVYFDTANGDEVEWSGPVVVAVSQDGEDLAVAVVADGSAFSYQSFGAWITGYASGAGIAAVGSFGLATTSTGVPASGSYQYYGGSMGFHTNSAGTPYMVASDAHLSVDFGTQSFSMNTSNNYAVNMVTAAESYPSALNLSGGGTISGAGLTGTLSAQIDMSGPVAGTFYGPNAQEVGGTFGLSGTGGKYIGSFGAAR